MEDATWHFEKKNIFKMTLLSFIFIDNIYDIGE